MRPTKLFLLVIFSLSVSDVTAEAVQPWPLRAGWVDDRTMDADEGPFDVSKVEKQRGLEATVEGESVPSDEYPSEQDETKKRPQLRDPTTLAIIGMTSFIVTVLLIAFLIGIGRRQVRREEEKQDFPTPALEPTDHDPGASDVSSMERTDRSEDGACIIFPLPASISVGCRSQKLLSGLPLREVTVRQDDEESDVSSVTTSLSNSISLLHQFEKDELSKRRVCVKARSLAIGSLPEI
jgi:hypothetical protein